MVRGKAQSAHIKAVVEKGSKTRTVLIKTAIGFFAEKGYDGTSFQAIANVCKVSQAVLLYHFKTKFGLFSSAIETIITHKLDLQIANKVEVADSKTKILHFLKSEVSFSFLFPSESQVFLLLYYFAAFDDHFAEIYNSYRKKWENEMSVLILFGIKEGRINKNVEVSQLSRIFYETILGLTTDLLSGRQHAQTMKELNVRLEYILVGLMGVKNVE